MQIVVTRRKVDCWDFLLKPLLNGGNAARQSSVVSLGGMLWALPHGAIACSKSAHSMIENYVLPALKFCLSCDWDIKFFTCHTAIQPPRLLLFTHLILIRIFHLLMLRNRTAREWWLKIEKAAYGTLQHTACVAARVKSQKLWHPLNIPEIKTIFLDIECK